ncbi:MAG TPA: hemolysin family protein [Chthonomonadaceae bacterium]|nr:hemolysin family protein [Chthonomonadaceae bacterium]
MVLDPLLLYGVRAIDAPTLIVQLAITLLLVFMNAFFVAAEFALVKVRPTRIAEAAHAKIAGALTVQRIHRHLDSYLSATQLGVTLASLALGWIGEQAVSAAVAPLFARLSPVWGDRISAGIGVAVAFTVITYFHIVFGELAPKWLAIQMPDALAIRLSGPLDLFYRICYPLIWFLNRTARFLLTRIGLRPANEHETAFSEAELRIALDRSEEGGTIAESAGDIADRAFHFGRGKVRDVMTPRPEVAFLDMESTLQENLDVVAKTNYARYPLCRGGLEDVTGRIHVRDLLILCRDKGGLSTDGREAEPDLSSIIHPVLYVPETKPLDVMLEDFRSQRMEMAIVQDEYGVTAGVVTLEDVLEELVGEIQQEFVTSRSEIDAMPDGSYSVDGKVTLSRLVREYSVGAEVEGIETVGGYVLSTHTGLPQLGYSVQLDGWRLEIAELAGRRIRRVRIVREDPAESADTKSPSG